MGSIGSPVLTSEWNGAGLHVFIPWNVPAITKIGHFHWFRTSIFPININTRPPPWWINFSPCCKCDLSFPSVQMICNHEALSWKTSGCIYERHLRNLFPHSNENRQRFEQLINLWAPINPSAFAPLRTPHWEQLKGSSPITGASTLSTA